MLKECHIRNKQIRKKIFNPPPALNLDRGAKQPQTENKPNKKQRKNKVKSTANGKFVKNSHSYVEIRTSSILTHTCVSLCLNITKIQGITIQTLKKTNPKTTIQNQNHKTQAPLNTENACDRTSMTCYLEL